MSVEIHAAVVEGILAGLTVLLGVLIAERLTRRSRRRERVERCALDLVLNLPKWAVAVYDDPASAESIGSPAWLLYQHVFERCSEIDSVTRARWSIREREAVRLANDNILGMLNELHEAARGGRALPPKKEFVIELCDNGLHSAVFGSRKPHSTIEARANDAGKSRG
jgi:hypothetical protein